MCGTPGSWCESLFAFGGDAILVHSLEGRFIDLNPAAGRLLGYTRDELLARCEWEMVKPLFDGLRREQFNLGAATVVFYDEREADLLATDEREYLARLRDNKRSEAHDEDEDFYRRHRN